MHGSLPCRRGVVFAEFGSRLKEGSAGLGAFLRHLLRITGCFAFGSFFLAALLLFVSLALLGARSLAAQLPVAGLKRHENLLLLGDLPPSLRLGMTGARHNRNRCSGNEANFAGGKMQQDSAPGSVDGGRLMRRCRQAVPAGIRVTAKFDGEALLPG
jgi:hypothetical protein